MHEGVRKTLWFLALWAGGVLSLTVVGLVIRAMVL